MRKGETFASVAAADARKRDSVQIKKRTVNSVYVCSYPQSSNVRHHKYAKIDNWISEKERAKSSRENVSVITK